MHCGCRLLIQILLAEVFDQADKEGETKAKKSATTGINNSWHYTDYFGWPAQREACGFFETAGEIWVVTCNRYIFLLSAMIQSAVMRAVTCDSET